MNIDLLDQAIAAHRSGQLAEAERLYRAVLAGKPDHPDALALLGVVLEAQGQAEAALPFIEQAIKQDPNAALFRFYLGNAQTACKNYAAAIPAYQQAIRLQPQLVMAHYNLGNALRLLDRWEDAGDSYGMTLQLAPQHGEARNNLALVHERAERWEDAVTELQRLVAMHPTYAEAWLNLCRIAGAKGDFTLSVQAAQQALKLNPQWPEAYLGLGVAYNRLEQHENALSAYQQALQLKPNWKEVWDNLGQTYQFLNRLEQAKAAYCKVIELAGQMIANEGDRRIAESEYGNQHWHLALLELLQGDYKNGFSRYRSRFAELKIHRPNFTQLVWQGENLQGKTLLVSDEQGMGDCLMLLRYLPLLKAQGARIILLVQAALAPLLQGWDGVDLLVSRGSGAAIHEFDYHASIFDLPYGFGTLVETIPQQIPYLPLLQPDAETRLETKLSRKVGVVWAGAPKHKHDARRSIPLALFKQIFANKQIQFYNLNRDLREGDAALLAAYDNVVDLVPRLDNFATLARFVQQMDLVITCDTATAHLAGGMGKSVWTLLPFAPDWRWLLGRDDSPWYPTMGLFRQPAISDWGSVIKSISNLLV